MYSGRDIALTHARENSHFVIMVSENYFKYIQGRINTKLRCYPKSLSFPYLIKRSDLIDINFHCTDSIGYSSFEKTEYFIVNTPGLKIMYNLRRQCDNPISLASVQI